MNLEEIAGKYKKKFNVLLVGSGGREHALAWAFLRSPLVENLYVAPGNGGTYDHNVNIGTSDVTSLVAFAKEKNCFTVVGPENPLEKGLVDFLDKEGLESFGPTKAQARIETSKSFAKDMMKSLGIPTAEYATFGDYDSALSYARAKSGDLVIKADGLAAGKGVFVCSTVDEAESALNTMFVDKSFGEASTKVVLEEKLTGYEVSLFALCDGRDALPFGTAMDHKRLLDGDRGPNTGGMGAFSPAMNFDNEQISEAIEKIVRPIVRKTSFQGFLYTGLMITEEGAKVLEFNARLGDPEAQCIIPRLDFDLFSKLVQVDREGILEKSENRDIIGGFTTCCVVMCSQGYPGSVETGYEISGIEDALKLRNALVFHAGTMRKDNHYITSGGRVLCVNGSGANLVEARERAYSGVRLISWQGEYHRTDIGKRMSRLE